MINLGMHSPPAGDSVTHILIELPLIAEYFFSDHFSIYGQVGMVINIVGEDGAVLHPVGEHGASPVHGIGIGLGNGMAATGGFSFYF